MYRIFANILIFVSILFFPWWATAIVLLGGIVFFRSFYEALAWALVVDILYGVSSNTFLNEPVLFTAGVFLGLFLIEKLKGMMRFY